jgi:hypothetical protein
MFSALCLTAYSVQIFTGTPQTCHNLLFTRNEVVLSKIMYQFNILSFVKKTPYRTSYSQPQWFSYYHHQTKTSKKLLHSWHVIVQCTQELLQVAHCYMIYYCTVISEHSYHVPFNWFQHHNLMSQPYHCELLFHVWYSPSLLFNGYQGLFLNGKGEGQGMKLINCLM